MIPHEVPLDQIKDKEKYLRSLFIALFDRDPKNTFDEEIELIDSVPENGLDTSE